MIAWTIHGTDLLKLLTHEIKLIIFNSTLGQSERIKLALKYKKRRMKNHPSSIYQNKIIF